MVIPGGTVNADQLRIDENAKQIIQYFTDHAKPIAAICHAPWVLINAERIKDKNLTSYKSIRLDLENAGANWVDETVHRCNTGGWVLISSRNPDDIPYFNQAIVQELTVTLEPSLKYHPGNVEVLTLPRNPGRGPCLVGSLTGAVSS